MGNRIPDKNRDLVRVRDHHRCARCFAPAPHGHLHHRRSRLVRDEHQHCPCTLVLLCGTCHTWVHAHPVEARDTGYMISKFEQHPQNVTMTTPLGRRETDCRGGYKYEQGGNEE